MAPTNSLAPLTDDALLREALGALKGLIDVSMPPMTVHAVLVAITKLEERLLREGGK